MTSRATLYLLCWLATVAAGISATLFSVYLPSLASDLMGSSEREAVAQLGSWAQSAFLGGWAIGAVLLGIIADRVGRKITLVASIVLCTLSTVVAAFVSDVTIFVLLRAITGTGAGAILLLTAVIVAEVWPSSSRALALGILINAFPLGFIIAGVMHGTIADFRISYLLGGIPILLAVAVWTLIPESERWSDTARDLDERREQRSHVFEPRYRRDLVIGVILFGSMLVALWAAYTWIPAWVGSISWPDHARHNRALANIMLGAGAVVGGIVSGTVSNALGRRVAAGLGYIGALIVSLFLFLAVSEPGVALFSLAFLLSFFIGYNQGVLTGYLPELFPTIVRGAATGFSFNTGRLVTTVTVFFVGVLVSVFGQYEYAILAFASFYLVGFVTLFFARETKGTELL
ncbi:MAG TPA: MFS transporter [Chlorobiota bacterium]|nr:MFS transporter [Chlorobiota bacterium]